MTSRVRPSAGAIATFAVALVAIVVLGLASGGDRVPSAEDYAGRTSLATRTLPQSALLIDPAEVADRLQRSAAASDDGQAEEAPEEDEPRIPPTTDDLLALPDPGGVYSFCCSDPTRAPSIAADALTAIDTARAALAEEGDSVGFLFLNCENGTGIAANIDELFYSASTMKAPFALFVCSRLLEGGMITLDDTLAISYASDFLEYELDSLQVEELIENAIRYSDNDSYRVLRANFESPGFSTWLESLGLDADRLSYYWYPLYDVREAAVFWLATYDYLKSETPHAQWLRSLLSETEVSFIRDGIGDLDGVELENKAGWIAEDGLAATNDNGLLTVNDTTYLLCILSDAPDSERSEDAVATLAHALFNTRADLHPAPSVP